MSSYYYTIEEPRLQRGSSSGVKGWRLTVKYLRYPEIQSPKTKLSRKNLTTPSVADSMNRRFRLPGEPVLFSCEPEALVKKKEFRDHVEDLIRGDCPRRSHAVERPVPVPTQLANARRQMRVMMATPGNVSKT